ncbi:hypothetical protein B0H10DRAFT_2029533 [Mycena sp. CBHHK59/15]|nr:hypothetical protein B0H10DRAFT_2029533 [Mycena sp. CBHHK59/15]
MWYVPPLFPQPTLISKSSTSFLLIPAVQASALLALDAPNAPLVPARFVFIFAYYCIYYWILNHSVNMNHNGLAACVLSQHQSPAQSRICYRRDIEIAKTYRERTPPISVLSSGWPVHSHLGPGADRDGWSLGLDVAVGTCSLCVQ